MSRSGKGREPGRRGVAAWALPLLVGVLLAPLASPLAAQQLAGDCQLMDTFRTLRSQEVAPGVSIVWVSRPDLRCPDGRRIQADSAVVYEAQGRNELIGNVRFTMPGRELRSRNADWYEREGRLFARGDVFLLDREEGTEVTGDTLIYLEARGTREEQVTVYGGRPEATLPMASETGGPQGSPYRVVANRLRFQGDRFFWGDGQVEVTRDELRAVADSLAYDREGETLILNRDARVDREGVVATGGNINVVFREGALAGVVARRDGRITTDDLNLAGAEVRVELDENEEITEVLAQGGDHPDTGEWILASLDAENLRVVARDQVEIRDDEETGERVMIATGEARAEALGRGFGQAADSVLPVVPPGDPDATAPDALPPGVPDRDWMEGSRIEAYFERIDLPTDPLERPADMDPDAMAPEPELPDAPAGTGSAEYRLARLVATGDARALYRSPPEDPEDETDPGQVEADPASDPERGIAEGDPPAPAWQRWPISYILADLITIFLVDGDVNYLEAEGNVRGLQLEPGDGGTE